MYNLTYEELGSGATARVYGSSNKEIAIKVFEDDYEETWQREVRALLAAGPCPHIIRMIEAHGWVTFVDNTPHLRPAITYERMATDMSDVIHSSHEGLPLVRVLEVGRDIANALAWIHARGIVHTDVKTGNILCNWSPDEPVSAKLADFGTAWVPGTDPQKHVGTVEYCAPEVITGQTYGPPCDIWAFGCTMFRLITLCHLFDVYNEDNYLECEVAAPMDNSTSAESSPTTCYRLLALVYQLIGAAPKRSVQRYRRYLTSRGQPIDHPTMPIRGLQLGGWEIDQQSVDFLNEIVAKCIKWDASDRARACDIVACINLRHTGIISSTQ